jgi:PAS domain S-box-containing protein
MNTDPQHHSSHWRSSLVQQRGKFILAIPVSCLVVSLCAFGWLQFKTTKAQSWVQHTQQVRLETGRLLTALLDAESGVWGYEIVRRQDFLTSYESEIVLLPDSLDRLKQLVADNPAQTQRLDRIRELVQTKVTSMNRLRQLSTLQQEKTLHPPEFVAQAIAGKQIMDRAKAEIEQFLVQEERLQAHRNDHLKQQQRLTWLVLSLVAGIGISGSLLAAYLLNRLAAKLTDRDRKLQDSEARYRTLIENFPNGTVSLFDANLRYILVDGRGLASIGLSSKQLEGKTIWEAFPPETCEAIEPLYRGAIAGTASTAEIPHAERISLMQVLPIRNERGEVSAGMAVTQDITDRKQSEQQLYQVNRALHTIGACNQALVRAADETTLLQDICQIIVECGGYRAAWIGFAESDEEKSVRPVAQVGFTTGHLESLQINWSDTERGRGPTGTAIRTHQVSVVQDILTDLRYLPWREAATQRGFASSIALPLMVEGQAIGALSIYASDVNAFDEAEVQLLTELATDLAFGIAALRTQLAHRQAEEALRSSEERFRAMFEKINAVKLIIDPDSGALVEVNPAASRFYGYSKPELIAKTIWEIDALPPEQVEALIRRAKSQEGDYFTSRHRLASGEIRDVEIYSSPVEIQGRLLLFLIVHDVSDRKRAEESLRESEAKFRTFLEMASEAVIVTNPNSEIVIFNAKAQELFGYEPTDVLGRTVEFLMPERYHHRHTEHRADYRDCPTKRSMSKTKNLYARRKNGTEFPIEAGLSPIQTNDGLFVMTFLTDITERKRAEEEIRRLNETLERRAVELETRYQQIVELAEEGIWVIDSQSQTNYVNHAMARMLGYTEEEMLGRSMDDFIDEAIRPTTNTNLARRKQGMAQKHEFKLKTKEGKELWVYMSTSPVLDEKGELLWSCSLVYEITERKNADEQLRQSSERISLANAELARATRLKDEFLTSMSHELRTPLNAILGLAEALQEEVYGTLTERQHKSLATIEQSGKHLLELINDILDLSKIESGKMELELDSICVQSLCESSLTFVKQQAHHKRIKLNCEIADGIENVDADERRIRQVLINLLSNAVKFTPDGGEVGLEVEADSESEIIQFTIIDTGIGIAPENLDRLFKPFVQLDSSLSRRYSGTGLGLALVRRIVELHGGSISLESKVAKGSRFTITLPWKKQDKIIQRLREQEPTDRGLPSIQQALIVEDSEAAATQVSRYLDELGAAATIHPLGEGSVEAAIRCHPDVIILDLLLPNLSGLEVLAQLKANPATQHIPVLVISVVDERARTLELGASEYLLKPISRQRFQAALSKIFVEAPDRSAQTALVVTSQPKRASPLILLAEDNEANISTMMDYLQVHGYQVSLARNGVEAVKIAKQQKPDLILMDIQMPEMDGLEATQRIRSDTNLATIPIIALTALAMPGDRERCIAAGAVEYITKPVGLKKLMSIITGYLNPSDG